MKNMKAADTSHPCQSQSRKACPAAGRHPDGVGFEGDTEFPDRLDQLEVLFPLPVHDRVAKHRPSNGIVG